MGRRHGKLCGETGDFYEIRAAERYRGIKYIEDWYERNRHRLSRRACIRYEILISGRVTRGDVEKMVKNYSEMYLLQLLYIWFYYKNARDHWVKELRGTLPRRIPPVNKNRRPFNSEIEGWLLDSLDNIYKSYLIEITKKNILQVENINDAIPFIKRVTNKISDELAKFGDIESSKVADIVKNELNFIRK